MSFPINSPIPAAQYVRMSDDQQQYSIENQKAAIEEYAAAHGFQTVKTYADPSKSGVAAKKRCALQQLLRDVVSGNAKYKAILVYDVSRWGDSLTTMKRHIMNFFARARVFRSTIVPNRSRTHVFIAVR